MPSFRFFDGPHGTTGCAVGWETGVCIGAVGDDAADALHKAADLAAQLSKLAKEHPEISAALTLIPGGGVALKAISVASEAAKYGASAEELVQKYGPRVTQAVAKILSLF
jgi:hypothetical protein